MGLLGKIWVKLGLDNSEFNKEIKESQGAVGNFKSFLSGIGKSIAAAFSVAAIIGFAKASIKAYNESALAAAKLESVLRSTGGAAGVSAKELTSYASDLQKITRFEDDATINAMALLATFKSIKGDIFKQTIASAQDLATVLGTDLNGAVMQLGKALEAPEIGLTMLRRSGISFSTQQIEQIKTLVSEGKKHEAQMVMLAEVQSQFGGAAKAAADTAAGAWVQLKNSFGDLMETIGSGTEKTKGFAGSLKIWVEQLDRLLKSQDVGFWGKLTGLFGGNQAAFRKANEEAERNLKYNEEAEKQAEAAMSVVTDLAEAERQLQILGKGTGILWRELFEQKLKTYIQSAKNAEQQKLLDEEEAEAAKKKAAAEEAARIAEEKHIEGSAKNLQYLIKLKQEEINLTTDENKRAALNQELANLEHRLAVMKLTTAELKAYNDLIASSKTPLPSVSNNIQGRVVVQNQKDPIKGVTNGIQSTTQQLGEFNDKLDEEVLRSADIAADFGRTVAQSISDSFQIMFDAIASGEKIDASTMVKAILTPFADMAVQMGEVMIATGVAAEAAKLIGKTGGGWGAIAAGVALVAIGTAAKSAIGAIGANFGKSGGSGGSSYGTTGGGMGSRWQPSSSMNMNINLTGVLKGQDLYLAVEKTKANKNR